MLVRVDLELSWYSYKVIAYASHNLTDVERRYSQTEKEALAFVWVCERFNLYVFSHEFELETDGNPRMHLWKDIEAINPYRKMGRRIL